MNTVIIVGSMNEVEGIRKSLEKNRFADRTAPMFAIPLQNVIGEMEKRSFSAERMGIGVFRTTHYGQVIFGVDLEKTRKGRQAVTTIAELNKALPPELAESDDVYVLFPGLDDSIRDPLLAMKSHLPPNLVVQPQLWW